MKTADVRATVVVFLVAGPLLVIFALGLSGARVNTSNSIAIGLYWKTNAQIERDAYVLVCPPATRVFQMARERNYLRSGRCPGGTVPLMKKVIAVVGDSLTIDRHGITVNGHWIEGSMPMTKDSAGRGLDAALITDHRIEPDEIVLFGDGSARSFDARYFGPLPRAGVEAVIRPVLIFPKHGGHDGT